MSYKEILFWFVPKLDTYKCVYCTRCKHSKCKIINGIAELYCEKFRKQFYATREFDNTINPSYYWHKACICYKDKYK